MKKKDAYECSRGISFQRLLSVPFLKYRWYSNDKFGKILQKLGVVRNRLQDVLNLCFMQVELDNETIEFMFAGINMFWARLRLILA